MAPSAITPKVDDPLGQRPDSSVGDKRGRQLLTSQFVSAIQELQQGKARQPTPVLAQQAHSKLQYDFPLVTVEEVDVLSDFLRDSLHLKCGRAPLHLTTKFVQNILAGARPPAAAPAQASTPAGGHNDSNSSRCVPYTSDSVAADLQLPIGIRGASQGEHEPAASNPAGAQATSGSGAKNDPSGLATIPATGNMTDAPAAANGDDSLLLVHNQEPSSLRAAYQRLCAVVLVHAVQHCLAASEQDAWAVLHSYEPEVDGDEPGEQPGSSRLADDAADGEEHEASMAESHGPTQQLAAALSCEAADEDPDDFVFEDIQPVGPSSCPVAGTTTAATRHGHTNGVPAPDYSWPELRSRLLALSGSMQYALLDDPQLWQGDQLPGAVLQLLRTLGVHSRASELQPLLHAHLGLLRDRVAAQPDELQPLLTQLWDAIGVAALASAPRSSARRRQQVHANSGAGPVVQPVLMPEAEASLSVVSGLLPQLSSASSRNALWQQVHRHLLPVLERSLVDLSREEPGPEVLAAAGMVGQVLEFYLMQRPGNVDAGDALKEAGVLSGLSVLFARCGGQLGAEPLRCAALCCAATSPSVHSWMLAVPGVSALLNGPVFKIGGTCNVHGAVWAMLAPPGDSPIALALLDGGQHPEQASRVHALLHLLTKATACGGPKQRRPLFSPTVCEALQQLKDALQAQQCATWPLEQQQQQPATCSNAKDAGESASQVEEEDEGELKLHGLDEKGLAVRRAKRLQPACWRMVKELLAGGAAASGRGKMD